MHRIVQLHSYGGTFHDLVDQLNATIVQTLMIDPQDAHLGAELQKLRKFGTALFVVVDSFPGGDRDVHALTSLFPDLTFVLTGPEATQGLSAKMFTPLRLGGEAFDRLEMREHIRFLEMDLDFDRL